MAPTPRGMRHLRVRGIHRADVPGRRHRYRHRNDQPGVTPDGFGSSNCRSSVTAPSSSSTPPAAPLLHEQRGGDAATTTAASGPVSSRCRCPARRASARVRYTLTAAIRQRLPLGFSELRVLGRPPAVSTPAFALAKKFQALIGREAHSTPIVVNLTDDNGDGRIDANDIPDIVVPVESTNNQLTGDLKAISGDDGHELFTAGVGPGLALVGGGGRRSRWRRRRRRLSPSTATAII